MDNSFFIIDSFVAMVLGSILAGVLIPRILLISFRKKLFDDADERKIHNSTVPRLGGIAFGPVILFTIFFIGGFNMTIYPGEAFEKDALEQIVVLSGMICSSILVYLVGIADDLVGVRYQAKFLVQVVAAVLLVLSGLWISDMHGIFGVESVPEYIGYPLTVFFVVFVINAVNLIDGIDGLASGLTMVALMVFGISFITGGDFVFALICFATLGVLLPFFYFNVFGKVQNRKKIFMGDTGSLTIGLILSASALRIIAGEGDNVVGGENLAVVAFSPLIVPCFDVVRVVCIRIKAKKRVFLPDRNHIHHRLLQAGMTQHSALITIVTFSLMLTCLNIVASNFVNVNILLVSNVLIYFILSMSLSRYIGNVKHNFKE